MPLTLINTLEISPYAFAKQDYESPNGSSAELPAEWDTYWRKCLSDHHLGNLRAIQQGSFLVDIESIGDQELEVLLKHELKDIDLSDYEEQTSKLDGGIALSVDGSFLIGPMCCGDIGNIVEWESIFQEATDSWQMLWIGHPWIFYRRVGDSIEFSDYYEANADELEDIKVLAAVQEEDLKHEVLRVKRDQIAFEQRIQTILDKLDLQNAPAIANLMTGNP